MKANSMDFQKGSHYAYPKPEPIDKSDTFSYAPACPSLITYDGKLHWYYVGYPTDIQKLYNKLKTCTGTIIHKGKILSQNCTSIDKSQLVLIFGFALQKKLFLSITPHFKDKFKYMVSYHKQGMDGLKYELFANYQKALECYNMQGNLPKAMVDEYGAVLQSVGDDQYRFQCIGLFIYQTEVETPK